MDVKVIRGLDKYFGRLICLFLGLFSWIKNKKCVPGKVLFLQLWGVGETILTLPAIKAFKQKYPGSDVSLLCTKRNKDVYYGSEDIDEIVVIELGVFSILRFMLKNLRKYDLVIDFEEYLNISAIVAFFVGKTKVGYSNQIRSILYDWNVPYNDKQHVVETHLDLVRLLGVQAHFDSLIRLRYSEKDKMVVDKVISELGISDDDFVVGFGAGLAESAKSRMWPEQRFAKLTDELIKKYNAKAVFFGTSNETGLNESIIGRIEKNDQVFNLAGKLTLRQAFAFIERCRLFISNDTGTMHIAAAQGVRTVGLFGPNLPVRWGPYGKGNVALYKGKVCEYSPCINVHKGQVPECFFGENNKCMKAISVKDVVESI